MGYGKRSGGSSYGRTWNSSKQGKRFRATKVQNQDDFYRVEDKMTGKSIILGAHNEAEAERWAETSPSLSRHFRR